MIYSIKKGASHHATLAVLGITLELLLIFIPPCAVSLPSYKFEYRTIFEVPFQGYSDSFIQSTLYRINIDCERTNISQRKEEVFLNTLHGF